MQCQQMMIGKVGQNRTHQDMKTKLRENQKILETETFTQGT